MSQGIKDQISSEDAHLIERHQLGSPLVISRIPLDKLYWYRWYYFVIIGMGVVGVILPLLMSLVAWQRVLDLQKQPPIYSEEISRLEEAQARLARNIPLLPFPVFVGGLVLVVGLYGYLIRFPQEQSDRFIACEQGILNVSKQWRTTCVEVVYWEEILAVKQGSGKRYTVVRREDKPLLFTHDYQRSKELLDLIKERSGIT